MLAVADRWQGNSELYLVNLANGGRRELITPVKEFVTRPRFSPDGKWIAYSKRVSLTSLTICMSLPWRAGSRGASLGTPGFRKVLPGAKMESAWWRFRRA